jgi:DNA-binding NarL/FixJ family response regulator
MVLALDPASLGEVLDGLAGAPEVQATGFRVSERRLSQERKPERNDSIEAMRRRGMTYGEIAQRLKLSRYTVRDIIKRRQRSVCAEDTHTAPSQLDLHKGP